MLAICCSCTHGSSSFRLHASCLVAFISISQPRYSFIEYAAFVVFCQDICTKHVFARTCQFFSSTDQLSKPKRLKLKAASANFRASQKKHFTRTIYVHNIKSIDISTLANFKLYNGDSNQKGYLNHIRYT